MAWPHTKYWKKLSCALGIICKARYKLTALASLLLYDSMFSSNLNYCNLIWATTYDSLLARILNLQKRLLKFCIPKNQTYIMQGIPVEPMSQYHIFHKLTIYGMRNLQLAKFMYNQLYITPFPQFQPFLQRNETLYHYNTRNKQNLHPTTISTNKQKYSVLKYGITLWNTIPLNIRNSPSVHIFMKKYKTLLLTS